MDIQTMLKYCKRFRLLRFLIAGGIVGSLLCFYRAPGYADINRRKAEREVEETNHDIITRKGEGNGNDVATHGYNRNSVTVEARKMENFNLNNMNTLLNPKQRANNLNKTCLQLQKLGQVPVVLPKNSYQYLYVNDKYKFIFCMMPKLACTNWKRIFLAISGKHTDKEYVINKMFSGNVHSEWANVGTTLSQYSDSEIEKRLQTYKKLIFVRNPFERLLSAFKDKMFRTDDSGFQSISRKIVRLKRDNSTLPDDKIKFKEFVKYLMDSDTHAQSYEQHWARYQFLCQPCIVKYDFIGKLESMNEDVQEAINYMGIQDELKSVKFPERNAAYKNVKSSIIMENNYMEVPKKYLKKLWEYFKIDFLSFSYEMPTFLKDLVSE